MLTDGADSNDLWIGIVPFSQSVNIGTGHSAWLSDYAGKMTYDNCVGPRTTPTGRTLTPR